MCQMAKKVVWPHSKGILNYKPGICCWWLVRVTLVVGFGFLRQNYGIVMGTCECHFQFCRWDDTSTWRWWKNLNPTCCSQTCLNFLHSAMVATQKLNFGTFIPFCALCAFCALLYSFTPFMSEVVHSAVWHEGCEGVWRVQKGYELAWKGVKGTKTSFLYLH